jgi:hypothetical protein
LQSLDLKANNLRIIRVQTVSVNGLFYLSSLHTNAIYDLSHHIEILHAGISQGICGLGRLDLSYFEIRLVEGVYYDQTLSVNAAYVLFYSILFHLALHVSTTLSHYQVLQLQVHKYQTATFPYYILYTCRSSQITS